MLRYWAYKEGAVQEWYELAVKGCKDQFDLIDKMLGGSKWMAYAKRLTKAEEYENEDIGVDFSYKEWTMDDPNPDDLSK
jgi:hypothetical protein